MPCEWLPRQTSRSSATFSISATIVYKYIFPVTGLPLQSPSYRSKTDTIELFISCKKGKGVLHPAKVPVSQRVLLCRSVLCTCGCAAHFSSKWRYLDTSFGQLDIAQAKSATARRISPELCSPHRPVSGVWCHTVQLRARAHPHLLLSVHHYPVHL